jgi:hypothetical protein
MKNFVKSLSLAVFAIICIHINVLYTEQGQVQTEVDFMEEEERQAQVSEISISGMKAQSMEKYVQEEDGSLDQQTTSPTTAGVQWLSQIFSYEENEEIETLISKSKGKILDLERKINNEREFLQNQTEEKISNVEETLKKEIKKIHEELQIKSEELRKHSAIGALEIVNQTEEAVLAANREKRRKELENELRLNLNIPISLDKEAHRGGLIVTDKLEISPKTRISSEWKNDLSKQFFADTSYVRKIILDGESLDEINDFNKKLSEQNFWFDNTLNSTCYVGDQNYAMIVQKQEQLHQIVQIQKKADMHFQKLLASIPLEQEQINKIRMTILYDLNSLIRKREYEKKNRRYMTILTKNEIQSVVNKAIEEFSLKFRKRTGRLEGIQIVDGKTALAVPVVQKNLEIAQMDLNKKNMDLEHMKNALKDEQHARKDLYVYAKQKIEEVKYDKLGIELQLKKNQNFVIQAQKDKDIAIETAAKAQEQAKKVSTMLEQAKKNSLNSQLELVKFKDNSQLELQKTTNVLQQKFAQTLEKEKSLFTEDLMNIENQLHRDLENKEKVNLALNVDLIKSKDATTFYENKTNEIAQENLQLKENLNQADMTISLTEKQFEEQSLLRQQAEENAQKQILLKQQAEQYSKLTQKLAEQTIGSINTYLTKQQATIDDTKLRLQEKEKNLDNEKKKLLLDKKNNNREHNELKTHKQLLQEERELLEGLKQETQKIVENSLRENDEDTLEIMKLKQTTELELREIKEEIRQELDSATERLDRIEKEKQMTQHSLQGINDEIAQTIHKGNLASLKTKLKNRKRREREKGINLVTR